MQKLWQKTGKILMLAGKLCYQAERPVCCCLVACSECIDSVGPCQYRLTVHDAAGDACCEAANDTPIVVDYVPTCGWEEHSPGVPSAAFGIWQNGADLWLSGTWYGSTCTIEFLLVLSSTGTVDCQNIPNLPFSAGDCGPDAYMEVVAV